MAQNRLKSLAMAFDRETNDILRRFDLLFQTQCDVGVPIVARWPCPIS